MPFILLFNGLSTPTNRTFLDSLLSDVNVWIKAIQVVTKVTSDVSSGTASQEVNF
ncbi:uncharacterized protein LACBIDRAFT_313078 [Laccaria bicolor S238N-H82]|uniref:Predicted protein n=1 Tax=Laccaria bicolor (strain S238N-H82 / ATCC MYA-4686) TaxID=486041 RepID=B0DXH1_LACBS|nr:uncharacterized protein LACBIDRAFT_313078 [Laccaria bicolor S238N-H82]EDR00678.1 predicted protein [Laccaria bicolor S238N-H82]|eukprot:XP_001888687.1 predicted protein [Laccaria bicolor S238N-H82]